MTIIQTFSPWVINACQIMSAIHFHSHIYEFSCKIKIHRKLRRSFFSWLYIYLLHWGEYVFYKSILFFLNKINYCYDSLSSLIKNETTDFRTTSILNLHCILVFQYFHTRGIYWIFSLTLFGMGRYFLSQHAYEIELFIF